MNRRKDAYIKLRKKYKVIIDGSGSETAAEIIPSFKEMTSKLNLSPHFMKGVQQFGYTKPTPVQMQAIPVLM